MSATAAKRDLIVVVADVDAEVTVRALLKRIESLQIRPISFQVDRFVKRDSGCYGEIQDYLRPFIHQFDYAIVIFDHDGSGRESFPREQIEADVEDRLGRNGWSNRSAAIVLDPELEVWVWSMSGEVPVVLGWSGRQPGLLAWLAQTCAMRADGEKPIDPKDAMHRALRAVGKRASAALFRQLAERVGLRHCTDGAFTKLRSTLQRWFPIQTM